ncbi:hypothetical protein ACEV74_23975 [Vibrio parahaemolyticus]|nr:hypothetical protein [Vibrio parahaemolyticus]HCG5600871.1 hypothetical protein [Vibrio parahaemolyticus]HCG5616949.1 hypothetical protein [Vibrio parahaemolyticus]
MSNATTKPKPLHRKHKAQRWNEKCHALGICLKRFVMVQPATRSHFSIVKKTRSFNVVRIQTIQQQQIKIMITICKTLGFDSQVLEKTQVELDGLNVKFTRCDKATMPLENFVYVLVDTKKWDNTWKADTIKYIPRNLNELFDTALLSPEKAIFKAKDKISALKEYLEKDGCIWSPAFSIDFEIPLSFSDGRHRFCLIRELGLPFFPVAVEEKHLDRLNQMDVLYSRDISITYDPLKWEQWIVQ